MMIITQEQNIYIHNCTIRGVIGQQMAALIFNSINSRGAISIADSLIQDCISKASLILIAYGNIEINNTKIEGVYASHNANILSMIHSRAIIHDSVFSNERNVFNYPTSRMDKVQAGVALMS